MSIERVEIFQGKDGSYFWHKKAGNGEVVTTAGEGFPTPYGALISARRENPELPVVDLTDDGA